MYLRVKTNFSFFEIIIIRNIEKYHKKLIKKRSKKIKKLKTDQQNTATPFRIYFHSYHNLKIIKKIAKCTKLKITYVRKNNESIPYSNN